MDRKFEESLSFVARHYRAGAFARRHFFAPALWRGRRLRVAASIAGAALLASACYFGLTGSFDRTPEVPVTAEAPAAPAESTVAMSTHIEFDNAPLSAVIAEIERIYNVKIGNIPTDEPRLTLSYDGTASDLVATINELLGTELTVTPL